MYSISIPKVLIVSLGLAGCLFSAPTTAATVLVSNLDQPIRGASVLPTDGWAAQSFTTGGASYSLSSIQVLLGNLVGSPLIVAELRAGDSSHPGAALTTFTVAGVPIGSPEPVTLTPVGGVILDAVSNYWLVLGVASPAGTFDWSYAKGNSTAGPGALGNFNYSGDSGSTWVNYGADNPFQIRVDVSPVPLPASAWLFGSGLVTLLGALRKRRFRVA